MQIDYVSGDMIVCIDDQVECWTCGAIPAVVLNMIYTAGSFKLDRDQTLLVELVGIPTVCPCDNTPETWIAATCFRKVRRPKLELTQFTKELEPA